MGIGNDLKTATEERDWRKKVEEALKGLLINSPAHLADAQLNDRYVAARNHAVAVVMSKPVTI